MGWAILKSLFWRALHPPGNTVYIFPICARDSAIKSSRDVDIKTLKFFVIGPVVMENEPLEFR